MKDVWRMQAMPLAGLVLVSMIVAAAWWLNQRLSLQAFGIGLLSLSLLLGMLLGNVMQVSPVLKPGIDVAQQKMLRLGVMLFGLHVSIGQLLHVGWLALGMDVMVMTTILAGGIWLGIRVFGMERDLVVMTAAGSAICGAAAVLATEPVVRGSSAHISMAVATVVLFGSLAMLIYPLIYHYIGVDPEMFGVYVGATVHEVAQVVAVGHSIGDGAEQTAVIVKLMRVMLLAPALLLLSLWWRRGEVAAGQAHGRLTIPWFAFGFIAVVVIHSIWPLSQALHQKMLLLDSLMLSAAMAGLGLETRFDRLRVLGLKPLMFAAVLFLVLVLGGGLLSRYLLLSV